MTYNFFFNLIAQYGYLSLFLIILVAEFGIPLPIPSEVEFVFVGYLIYMGKLNFYESWLIGALADYIGTMSVFTLINALDSIFFDNVLTKLKIDKSFIKKVQYYVNKHEGVVILIGRFIPYLRFNFTVAAAIIRVNKKKFTFFTAVASCIWTGGLIFLGFKLGYAWKTFISISSGYSFLGYIFYAIILLFIINYLIRIFSKRNH